jgi:hypothetical protein
VSTDSSISPTHESPQTFTPGPWFLSTETRLVEGATLAENKFVEVPTFPVGVLSSHRHGAEDPEQICFVGNDLMSPEDEAENIANARLIAAAPDLLGAIDKINMMACYASEENTDARADMLLQIGLTARAAIAKAEGEGSR